MLRFCYATIWCCEIVFIDNFFTTESSAINNFIQQGFIKIIDHDDWKGKGNEDTLQEVPSIADDLRNDTPV